MAEYEWKIGLIEMVFMKQYSRMPPKITHSQSNNVSRNFYSLLLLFCLPYFIFFPNFSFFFFCSLRLAQSSINSFFTSAIFCFLSNSKIIIECLRMFTKVWIKFWKFWWYNLFIRCCRFWDLRFLFWKKGNLKN